MAMDSAKRVFNGTFGYVWIDGEPIAEITAGSAKYNYNKTKIGMAGQFVNDQKVMSADGVGSVTMHKVNSRFLQDHGVEILQGKDSRCTIVMALKDPDAYGYERVALYNCSFDDLTLADFKHGETGSITRAFTFTRHELLDAVEV